MRAIWRTLAVAVALAAVTGGCRKPPGGAVTVVAVGPEPRIVDPAAGPLSAGEAILLQNAAQGLVRFDAGGEIIPGLAERWNVSDDGLSYVFRIATAQWPDGRPINAHDVVRALRREIGSRSNNSLKDTLGAVEEIVAMTDRVIEIRLRAPRPSLLQLLAQPEFAVIRNGQGSGPFQLRRESAAGTLRLSRKVPVPDSDRERREEVRLAGARASVAVAAFYEGKADLVLGGTFANLPYARAVRLPRGSLRFDPVAGLFGLVPARSTGPVADRDVRRLLAQAIDRDALLATLAVPGLLPRATVVENGLEGMPPAVPPQWSGVPLADRRGAMAAQAARLFGATQRPLLRIAVPDGPGGRMLLARLKIDWAAIGIAIEPAGAGRPADLSLIDAVAPSSSPAWFLRQFRCGQAAICDAQVDGLLEGARAAPVPLQRAALLLQAAQRIDQEQLFIPIAAPVRWSLVSRRIVGFAGNRFGRHSLTGLEDRRDRE